MLAVYFQHKISFVALVCCIYQELFRMWLWMLISTWKIKFLPKVIRGAGNWNAWSGHCWDLIIEPSQNHSKLDTDSILTSNGIMVCVNPYVIWKSARREATASIIINWRKAYLYLSLSLVHNARPKTQPTKRMYIFLLRGLQSHFIEWVTHKLFQCVSFGIYSSFCFELCFRSIEKIILWWFGFVGELEWAKNQKFVVNSSSIKSNCYLYVCWTTICN